MALALRRTELTLLRRISTAASTAVALPFAFGAFWVFNEPELGEGWEPVIVLQVLTLLGFTLHVVETMALAARREQLVLKRWRSSQASPSGVLAGSWTGPTGGSSAAWMLDAWPSLAVTVLPTAVATAAAVHYFRWEPRT